MSLYTSFLASEQNFCINHKITTEYNGKMKEKHYVASSFTNVCCNLVNTSKKGMGMGISGTAGG